jgi:predicted AlkP superfamily pyrophosphatase or phosphodiesterase
MKGNSRPSRLIVLSVDGMRPDFYRRPKELGLKIPNLLELVGAGVSADLVESIYPTTTYPAHATLVTGVPPSAHGIYCHLASLDPTEKARPWCWFAAALRVPTLWDVVRATGRKTAAVSWPVSAGAAIDYNIPEIWDPKLADPHQDFTTAARHSTRGLFPDVIKALEPILGAATPDRLRSEAALYIWARYRPDLLLVHFVDYDQSAHKFGPTSPQALAAIEQTDEEIGRFRSCFQEAEPPTLVVLSDHGFVPVENEAAPLSVLAAEGLFEMEADGAPKLAKLGAVPAGGSFSVYWLEEPAAAERTALQRAVKCLVEAGVVEEVVDRARLESLSADPDAELSLDAAPGIYFSDRFEGPLVRETVKDRGTHGQLPTRPGLGASFIAAGPDVGPGRNLGCMALTQVAPTLASWLGLPTDILASNQKPILELTMDD